MPKATKAVVIGLDGATFDVLNPLMDEGFLPNMKRIRDAGAHGPLRSTYPPVSEPSWVAMATGRNPGKTGVYDVFLRSEKGQKLRSLRSSDFAGSCYWDHLSGAGKRVGIVNYIFLHPPYPVNGFMIGGVGSPKGGEIAYPPDLMKSLERHLGEYEPDSIFYHNPVYTNNEPLFLRHIEKALDQRIRLLKYCATHNDWDLLVFVFYTFDVLMHYMWKHWDSSHPRNQREASIKYKDEIKRLWGRLDEGLGEFFRLVDDEVTTFIVSDHGSGPVSKCFYVNKWLEQEGYLRRDGKKRLVTSSRTKLERSLKRLSPTAYNWLKALFKKALKIERRIDTEGIDFAESVAVAQGTNRAVGSIYIREGLDVAAVREEIVSKLRLPRLPFEVEVHLPEEIYWGDKLERAPDILVNVKDFEGTVDNSIAVPAVCHLDLATPNQSGHHRMKGIFMAAGPGIEKKELKGEVIDIAPTILKLFGFDSQPEMDGNCLDIFKTSVVKHQSNCSIGVKNAGEIQPADPSLLPGEDRKKA